MNSRRHDWSICLAAIALLTSVGTLDADEHPEHPKNKPQRSEESRSVSSVTMTELADAITAYVVQDAELKGGFFLVYDKEEKLPLVLTLDRVHKDRLSRVGDAEYFACADFKTPDGRSTIWTFSCRVPARIASR